MFFGGSRYSGAGTYEVTCADGTVVTVTRIPLPSARNAVGWHRRGEGERLDLIAYQYLRDATGFWVLCDTNDAVVPDALAAHALIAIPGPGS
ncbi:hypothetical protein [Mycobacterium sp.]|uniref:hypothetical protein n=1 Tax=Mycobacterium sp. TaxID=1785 RepID=UPI003D122344